MRAIHCALIVTALVASAPAIARDQLGTQAIQAGDYNKAEQILVSELRFNPDMPELKLNLAHVYRHTGRVSDARALYREVLSSPDVMLDQTSAASNVSSHAAARAALEETTRPVRWLASR